MAGIDELTELIDKARAAQRRIPLLERSRKDAQARLDAALSALTEEERDVARLRGISFAHFVSLLRGEHEQALDRESAEVAAQQLRVEAAKHQLAAVDAQLRDAVTCASGLPPWKIRWLLERMPSRRPSARTMTEPGRYASWRPAESPRRAAFAKRTRPSGRPQQHEPGCRSWRATSPRRAAGRRTTPTSAQRARRCDGSPPRFDHLCTDRPVHSRIRTGQKDIERVLAAVAVIMPTVESVRRRARVELESVEDDRRALLAE